MGLSMKTFPTFSAEQLRTVTEAVCMSEELVSNFYKLSDGQWLHARFDVKTLAELSPAEIVDGPFAQIIRYEGQRRDTALGFEVYDFYKICLQDHTILATLEKSPQLRLLPFTLYIGTHELIHIVRFSKFLQNFNAPPAERMVEENRVHSLTREILAPVQTTGLRPVLEYYSRWRQPFENLHRPSGD